MLCKSLAKALLGSGKAGDGNNELASELFSENASFSAEDPVTHGILKDCKNGAEGLWHTGILLYEATGEHVNIVPEPLLESDIVVSMAGNSALVTLKYTIVVDAAHRTPTRSSKTTEGMYGLEEALARATAAEQDVALRYALDLCSKSQRQRKKKGKRELRSAMPRKKPKKKTPKRGMIMTEEVASLYETFIKASRFVRRRFRVSDGRNGRRSQTDRQRHCSHPPVAAIFSTRVEQTTAPR